MKEICNYANLNLLRCKEKDRSKLIYTLLCTAIDMFKFFCILLTLTSTTFLSISFDSNCIQPEKSDYQSHSKMHHMPQNVKPLLPNYSYNIPSFLLPSAFPGDFQAITARPLSACHGLCHEFALCFPSEDHHQHFSEQKSLLLLH